MNTGGAHVPIPENTYFHPSLAWPVVGTATTPVHQRVPGVAKRPSPPGPMALGTFSLAAQLAPHQTAPFALSSSARAVVSAALPLGSPSLVRWLVDCIQGAPACVRIFQMPSTESPVCNKSFYKADKVTMSWNKRGSALLVSAQTEVDTTGQSYYGETNLYYMSVKNASSISVELGKTAD